VYNLKETGHITGELPDRRQLPDRMSYIHIRLISTYDTPHSGTMICAKSCWEMFRCYWQSIDIIK